MTIANKYCYPVLKVISMREKKFICFALAGSLLCFAACTPGTLQPKPVGTKASLHNSAVTETPQSARYYYLESRFHLQANDLDNAIAAMEKALQLDPDSFMLTRELAQLYLAKDDKSKAVSLIEALITKNPDNVDGLLLFVQVKKDDMDEDQLKNILKKILSLDPENKESYLRLGRIYMESQSIDNAMVLFKQMTQVFPDYYVGWYYLGELYLQNKEYVLSESAFLKTIELEPELVEPRFQLINAYKALNTPDTYSKIEAGYDQILELAPDNHRALLGMALNLYKTGRIKEAQKLFMTLAQDIDKDPGLVLAAFDEYINGTDKKDAVIVFSQMLKTNPTSSTLNFFTAIVYQNVKNHAKAIALYQKVVPDHPQYKKAGLSIALLYNDLGKRQIAINVLESRLRTSPKDADILKYLASFYEQEQNHAKAISLLKEGLAHHPENTDLMFRLGVIQDKIGQKEDAIKTMAAVIEIDPSDASALNYLGYTLADQGIRLPEALALIQKAYDLKPDDAYIIDSLGWVHFQLKNYSQAILYLEKAADLTNFQTVIADHLGDAYDKTTQPQKALAAYKKAIVNAVAEDDKKLTPRIQEKITALQNRIND